MMIHTETHCLSAGSGGVGGYPRPAPYDSDDCRNVAARKCHETRELHQLSEWLVAAAAEVRAGLLTGRRSLNRKAGPAANGKHRGRSGLGESSPPSW